MSAYDSGQAGEDQAARFLEDQGYRIEQRNWRNRYCEIDLVAKRNGTVYFVEVKYRRDVRHGNGLDYIVPSKLRRMVRAAEAWVSEHAWEGPYQLAAVGLDGKEVEFIENVEL